ncbi:MAG: FecR domain-containing protein [Prevotellaceae bacterium]|nr:FecR domain-containing protein [Prevotellaceae bacterium]
MNDTTIYRYFKGETTPEEEKQLLDWVDASPENRETFLHERALFDAILFAKLPEKKPSHVALTFRRIVRVAAVVVILIGGALLADNYLFQRRVADPTIFVPAGQRACITLPDGSRVWLNAQSQLTYPVDFGRDERRVALNGEAFFEVNKDSRRPFFVHTEMNDVRVVGTSFNICAYDGSHSFEATLTEGVVDIYPSDAGRVITRLEKGQYFSNENGVYRKTVLPSYEYLRWREGLYCFDDVSFATILSKLEKYYNVNISMEDSTLLDYGGCTGKFREQDGVEHILRVIAKDHPFRFRINETKDSISIYR